MAETARGTDKLNVFISYSREDLDFADQLHAALTFAGHQPKLDRHGISGGENWQSRLGAIIREADTVVFVLSPTSARSEICEWEVEEAVRVGKRIIPVLCRPLGEARAPQLLHDLNYIFFYAEPKSPGSGFGTGIARLDEALRTDLEWLREHTRLLQRATEWEAAGRPETRLLSGSDIAAAKAWAARRPRTAPEPTALHADFIRASEDAEGARHSAERRRLEEMARVQEERGAALKAAEDASRQRARLRIGALVGLSLVATLAVWQWSAATRERAVAVRNAAEARQLSQVAAEQSARAEAEKTRAQTAEAAALKSADEAKQSRDEALETSRAALLAQSKYLADLALHMTEKEHEAGTGLLLALEALPDAKSDDPVQRQRPYWAPAEVALHEALRNLREQAVWGGHSAGISSLLVLQDGRIVSASHDRTARIRDAKGKELATLIGHTQRLTSLATLADGRIVTGSHDRTARIWDAKGGNPIVLRGHADTVDYVTVLKDDRIVTGSFDGSARVWGPGPGEGPGAKNWRELAVLKGHKLGINKLGGLSDGRVVTGSDDGTVRVWDARSGEALAVLEGPKAITNFLVLPDDRIVTSSFFEGPLKIWDAKGGPPLATLNGHAQGVGSLTLLADGRLISGGIDGAMRTWNAADGAELSVVQGAAHMILRALSDGRIAVSNSDGVAVQQTTGGRFAIRFTPPKHAWVNQLAALSDGRIVSGHADGTLRLWDTSHHDALAVLKGPDRKGALNPIHSLAVLPNGRLVTGSDDKTARVWDIDSGRTVATLEGHKGPVHGVVVLRDDRIATRSEDRTVRVWDADTGAETAVLEGHTERITSLAAMAGDRVVTGSVDRTARVWDAKTGATLAILTGHTGVITSVATLPDGRIVTASSDSTARIWKPGSAAGAGANDWRDLAVLVLKHTKTVAHLAILGDGQLVTCTSDASCHVWNTTTGAELAVLKGHATWITGVAALSDGRVVTSAGDGTGRIWDAKTGAELVVLKDDGQMAIRGMSELPDGRIATISVDATVRIWDGRTGALLARLRGHSGTLTSVLALPSGRIATASIHGTARVWDVMPSGQPLVDRAKQRAPRCLTSAERQLFHLPPEPPSWCAAMSKWPFEPLKAAERHMIAKRWPEAIASFRLAIEHDPSVAGSATSRIAVAHNEIAWTHFLAGRAADGLADAEKAVALAPQNRNIVDTRGQIYLELGRVDEALADLDRAITLGLKHVGTFYGRGRAHELKGNRDAAIADYRQALLIEPRGDYVRAANAKARERLTALGHPPDDASVPRR